MKFLISVGLTIAFGFLATGLGVTGMNLWLMTFFAGFFISATIDILAHLK